MGIALVSEMAFDLPLCTSLLQSDVGTCNPLYIGREIP